MGNLEASCIQKQISSVQRVVGSKFSATLRGWGWKCYLGFIWDHNVFIDRFKTGALHNLLASKAQRSSVPAISFRLTNNVGSLQESEKLTWLKLSFAMFWISTGRAIPFLKLTLGSIWRAAVHYRLDLMAMNDACCEIWWGYLSLIIMVVVVVGSCA